MVKLYYYAMLLVQLCLVDWWRGEKRFEMLTGINYCDDCEPENKDGNILMAKIV